MGSKLTGFLRNLVAPGKQDGPAPESLPWVDYKGFQIAPTPESDGSQWQTAGLIRKEFPEGVKEQSFIRADKCATKDQAEDFSITKAKQIIDEQGDRLFKDA
jgi:hypothetical protein